MRLEPISNLGLSYSGKCSTLRIHLSILLPIPTRMPLNMNKARKDRTMMMAKDTQYVLTV